MSCVATDPMRCDECGHELVDGDVVVSLTTETIRIPNGQPIFDTECVETRRHVSCLASTESEAIQ